MNQFSFGQIFSIFSGLYAFTTLVFPKLTSLMVLLMLTMIIVGYIKKQLLWKLSWPTVFFVSLYLAYLIGIFYSLDKSEGLKYAEYKVSFLILPILLSFIPRFEFKLNYAFYGLVAGILALIFIGVLNSMNCYSERDSAWLKYCFTSSYISPVHHPSYFASFILFAIAGVLFGRKESWWGLNIYSVTGFVVVGLMMYFLCLTLAGIIFLGIVLVALLLHYLYKRIGLKWLIPLSFIAIFLAVIAGLNLPGFKYEIKESTQSYSEFASSPEAFLYRHAKEEYIPGNEVRLIMWKISIDLIAEHPFGVGTGSVDEYLNARLERYGLNQMAEEDYNPHNQYLQTTLEIGFIGLFLLLGLITSVIYFSIKYRSYLFLLLISGLAFNCLFESMLQRQSAIVFYSFWIPLIILSLRKKSSEVEKVEIVKFNTMSNESSK